MGVEETVEAQRSGRSRSLRELAFSPGGCVVGLLLSAVGAITMAWSGALGLPVALVGAALVAGSAVSIHPRCGAVGRLVLGVASALVLVLVGFGLGMWSYDEKYFDNPLDDDEPSRIWWHVSDLGALMLLLGLFLLVCFVLALIGVAVARFVRRPAQ